MAIERPSIRAIVAIGLSAVAAFQAAAQDEPGDLLSPSWDDPFLAEYLRRDAAREAPGGDAVSFSLPVLGFATGAAAGDASPGQPLGDQLAARVPDWPDCARPRPDIVTVPDGPEQAAGSQLGTWFTATYDFGCLQVVVDGDRNAPDPDLVATPDAAPESGTISIAYHDENAGLALDAQSENFAPALDRPGPAGAPLVSYTRGGLTYTINVACTPASEALCANPGALRVLTEQLVPIAGRPQP